jgi:hypothetical protein
MENDTERCDHCGEAYDEDRPNAGDGWAEMFDPKVPAHLSSAADHFTGHYMCGLGLGLELA